MRRVTLAAAAILFAAAISTDAARVESAPAIGDLFPAAFFPSVQVPASNFNLELAAVEYGPGAYSATESHQGTRFFVVMEGELTIVVGDKTGIYGAGKSVISPPGAATRLSNTGTKPARVYYSAIVPATAASNPSTIVAPASAPPPKVLSSGSFPVRDERSTIDVYLTGFWLDPGGEIPNHVHNFFTPGVVIEGVVSIEYMDGGKQSFTAGQGYDMSEGRPGAMVNRGTTRASVTHTWLATPGGKELLTMVEARAGTSAPASGVTPPRTGDAGLASAPDAALTGWAYAAAAFGALGMGALSYVRSARRLARSERG